MALLKEKSCSVQSIGYHNDGQLVDALVVNSGNACTATVSASVQVNDEEMGSAVISAESVSYGAEITVTPTPNNGYKVKTVDVTRVSRVQTLTADANGAYKFNAEVKNKVFVTFELDESAFATTYEKIASYDFSSELSGTSEYTSDELLDRFNDSASDAEGLSNIVLEASEVSKVYPGQANYTSYGIKFGTGSANGTFTLKLSKNVVMVVVNTAGWTATDSLTIGDADAQVPAVAYTADNPIKTLVYNITPSNDVTFTFSKRGFIQSIDFYSINLSSVSNRLAVNGTEEEDEIVEGSVSLRFGASIPVENWNTINANWEITEYGVMMIKKSSLTASDYSSIEAAYGNRKLSVVSKNVADDGLPFSDGENYLFTAGVNSIPSTNYDTVICAAPYIVAGGAYIFLSELEYSVVTMAEYCLANGGSNLSDAALGILANN